MKPRILTVSELTRDIKLVLEEVFGAVWVEGEVSNLSRPASGHVYFSLKDEAATLRCVMFRSAAARLKFRVQDGVKILVGGRVGVYEKGGQYQLYAETLEPRGAGALQLAFEQLKKKLAAEGLFDDSRKKPLPFLPQRIGVVTSPTGAVIRDILHVLARRFPGFHLILSPVRVQGEGAAAEIASAVAGFNADTPVDVIIVARGGGSLEDLWAFNEEVVARAIAASRIPVISAVGHETDYTIADFVADRRAPTPSAAAEIVLPARAELVARIEADKRALRQALADIVPQYAQRVDDLTQELTRGLERRLRLDAQRCDSLARELPRALKNRLRLDDMRFKGLYERLNALSPLAILGRGYSVTVRADGSLVMRARDAKPGERLTTRLSEGRLDSEVLEVRE
ncbi:MAG: exodeoxyribonuclease VII large subunit [Deltaproteobacteria bacterium]